MKSFNALAGLLTAAAAFAQQAPDNPPAARVATSLTQVRRIYVSELAGGPTSTALREVLIAGLNSTGLFILTDDENRADAILKGAAEDKTYTDTFDSDKSISGRNDAGVGSRSSRSGGGYGGSGGGDREAYHLKERKHEAYASVRLVNRAGDTLWSTTQESMGAKFRGAGADLGMKVARQITLDMDRAARSSALVRP